MRTGIPARISQDKGGQALGVARQLQDCREVVQQRGWIESDTYVDNDVSASRGKRRPEYERMLADIRSGFIDAICVWDIDRLTRTPRELEDIIDLADQYKLSLANVAGEVNLSTSDGRLHARLKGIIARQEVEQQSKRLKRKFQERAENGHPHGYTPYGYERVQLIDENGHSYRRPRRDAGPFSIPCAGASPQRRRASVLRGGRRAAGAAGLINMSPIERSIQKYAELTVKTAPPLSERQNSVLGSVFRGNPVLSVSARQITDNS